MEITKEKNYETWTKDRRDRRVSEL